MINLMMTATIHKPAPTPNHFQSACEILFQPSKPPTATNTIPTPATIVPHRFASPMPAFTHSSSPAVSEMGSSFGSSRASYRHGANDHGAALARSLSYTASVHRADGSPAA